ncbi:MAG: transketolase C-terminal domain-containing protein [Spirochaetaceae bacterium]|nr:transketolase C-terminal domain-containing protein [Spirochaetaceae bacterium]
MTAFPCPGFPSPTPMRDAFGKALVQLGASNPDVVALTADLAEAVKVHWFAEKFPERFFEMGIAESDMMGTAAGLALAGKLPFATTFAVFATSLANQAVRVSVGYNKANVKIATSHGGICVGADGATHQSFEDLALMRLIPGMTVIAPCDANEAWKATFAAAALDGPVYLRFGRIPTAVFTLPEAPFVVGKANRLREGSDVAIAATGMAVGLALEAAASLEARGLSCRVLGVHTLKPLDEGEILAAASDCGALVAAEEHTVIGGLGEAIASLLARRRPTPMEFVGVADTFGESGEPAEILEKYGITAGNIVQAALRSVSRK